MPLRAKQASGPDDPQKHRPRNPMSIDPLETKETAEAATSSREHEESRLSTLVAITIALLATFLGVCKVKDDNIVQAMHQAQADKIDGWAFYQARNIREEVAKATMTQLELQAMNASAALQPKYEAKIAEYRKIVEKQSTEKEKLMQEARGKEQLYKELNEHDDQFDLSDALLAIAISLLAVTALTHKRWLYYLALVPTIGGVIMGLAGLLSWNLKVDAFSRWLS